MSRETAMPGSGYRHNRQPRPQQMDLFGSGPSNGAIGAPAWPELPAEARAALTSLMTQLSGKRYFRPQLQPPSATSKPSCAISRGHGEQFSSWRVANSAFEFSIGLKSLSAGEGEDLHHDHAGDPHRA
jgi:hypothetical protein